MQKDMKSISIDTIYDHYYLKEELVAYCRTHQLPTTGGKELLTQRIGHYLSTGEILASIKAKHKKTNCPEVITLDSIIEENFVCSQKHREFFAQQIGTSFSFKVTFQTWLKQHAGKTYQEAILAYYELMEKQKHQPTTIDKQFEYNTYIRAFFADNKGKSLNDAIKCWNYKKSKPGKHMYDKEDLHVLQEQ